MIKIQNNFHKYWFTFTIELLFPVIFYCDMFFNIVHCNLFTKMQDLFFSSMLQCNWMFAKLVFLQVQTGYIGNALNIFNSKVKHLAFKITSRLVFYISYHVKLHSLTFSYKFKFENKLINQYIVYIFQWIISYLNFVTLLFSSKIFE